ncbi:MAG TPA: TIGR03067 domain-containing protein [Gemmatales bacterium]|nr:TIGR03067 domain-containing protein [Gemmatales bacterium]
MQRIICVLIVLASPLLLAADDAVQKELQALQGTWKAVSLEAEGKPVPKEAIPQFIYIIGADGKATGKMAQGGYSAKVTIDPTKNPKTMDNLHESGTHKGKKQHAVYKLEGDKLTVCITAPGSSEVHRPKDFSTRDSANVLFVFKRVK